jgi:hypothetical protein
MPKTVAIAQKPRFAGTGGFFYGFDNCNEFRHLKWFGKYSPRVWGTNQRFGEMGRVPILPF